MPLSSQTVRPANAAEAQEHDLAELRAFLQEVGRSEEDITRLVKRLGDISNDFDKTTQNVHVELGAYVPDWIRLNTPDGKLSGRLFREPPVAINAWISAIESGVDRYPPMDEIRAERRGWLQHRDDLISMLSRTIPLENQRLRLTRENIDQIEKESSGAAERSRQIESLASEIRNNLAAAQSDLAASLNIQRPIPAF